MSGDTASTHPYLYGRSYPGVMFDPELSDKAKLLYSAIDYYGGRNDRAFPSRKTLSEKLACSIDTIDRTLRALEEKGLIVITRRWDAKRGTNASNHYHAVLPPQERDPSEGGVGGTRAAQVQRSNDEGGGPHPCGQVGGTRAARWAAPVRPEPVPVEPVPVEPVPTTAAVTASRPAASEPLFAVEPEMQLPAAKARRKKPAGAPTDKYLVPDAITTQWWADHQSETAQSYISIRGVVRTAIGNGLSEDRVRSGLEILAREGRAISGGNLQYALQPQALSRPLSRVAEGDAIMARELEWAIKYDEENERKLLNVDYIDGEVVSDPEAPAGCFR